MRNFCTLFDSRYLPRGIAMLESLRSHCVDCRVIVFAFDDQTKAILDRLALPGVETVALESFEDDELRRVKSSRTAVEYMWTCTPSVVLYSLTRFSLDACTYLDADLYFYCSPETLFGEMGDNSILITPHNYHWLYNQSHRSGVFCVQFVTFRNDPNGLAALHWWRDACLDWCYARAELGRFGDQKYLDDWPARFRGIHVLQHEGGGAAPWNIQRYRLRRASTGIVLENKQSLVRYPLIFYHFHDLKLLDGDFMDFGWYLLSTEAHQLLYRPYIRHLEAAAESIRGLNPGFSLYSQPPSAMLSLAGMKRLMGLMTARRQSYLEGGS
jgi:hypothetical protein